ncbi:hypothetical protein [Prevotella sp. 10(H)]|uniref:hypothetical protein n=1 Tax=Prevotella sp. 10(H) TaxID=1158294 RepID=UPI0004A6F19B|nr:hypothetical protein [Prevotella sp. 10(H)]
MPNTDFNGKLIQAIIKACPSKLDQADCIMEATSLSKESAYRRLRGEVPFTFTEACLITSKLGISLDDIAASGNRELTFQLRMDPDNLIHYNYQKLYEHEDSFNTILGVATEVMTTWNVVPYSLLLPYDNLAKFYIFKWTYQTHNHNKSIKYNELKLPDDIQALMKMLGNQNFESAKLTFIYDRNIFKSFLGELKHFHLLKLISDEDLSLLKEEFLHLLNKLEGIAMHGTDYAGNPVEVYLSDIDFEHNYTYIKGDNVELAYIDNIYLMNTLISLNPKISKMHKYFIESLRKYSTLISISGGKERRDFFDQQREMANSLLV